MFVIPFKLTPLFPVVFKWFESDVALFFFFPSLLPVQWPFQSHCLQQKALTWHLRGNAAHFPTNRKRQSSAFLRWFRTKVLLFFLPCFSLLFNLIWRAKVRFSAPSLLNLEANQLSVFLTVNRADGVAAGSKRFQRGFQSLFVKLHKKNECQIKNTCWLWFIQVLLIFCYFKP